MESYSLIEIDTDWSGCCFPEKFSPGKTKIFTYYIFASFQYEENSLVLGVLTLV